MGLQAIPEMYRDRVTTLAPCTADFLVWRRAQLASGVDTLGRAANLGATRFVPRQRLTYSTGSPYRFTQST